MDHDQKLVVHERLPRATSQSPPTSIQASKVDSHVSLVGFLGQKSWSIGEVLLEITIGDASLARSETLNFIIVRSNSSYNMLLERKTMQKIVMVVSTIHRAVKFHTTQGIETVFSTQESDRIKGVKKVRKTSSLNIKGVLSCINAEERIIVNSKYPEKTVTIRKQHPEHFKERLQNLLRTNADIFAWTHADMTGIPGTITGAELNYPTLEKLILALVHAARRLRRYFQAHTVAILTNSPIKQALTKPEKSGRVAKWEGSREKDRHEARGNKLSCEWKLYTDRASSSEGSGASLMLIDPEGKEYTYALRFKFDTMNNEGEYEALLAGLRIAQKMEIVNLAIFVESQLLVSQVKGIYAAKKPAIREYLQKTKETLRRFGIYTIEHVRRNQNKKVDALRKLASMTFEHLTKEVLVEVLVKRSIDEKEVLRIEIKEEESRIIPSTTPPQTNDVIKDIHEGSYGFNAKPRLMVVRITKQGYYWPSMHRDVSRVIQDCEKCKEQPAVKKRAEIRAIAVGNAWPTLPRNNQEETPFSLTYGSKAIILTVESIIAKDGRGRAKEVTKRKESKEVASIEKAYYQIELRRGPHMIREVHEGELYKIVDASDHSLIQTAKGTNLRHNEAGRNPSFEHRQTSEKFKATHEPSLDKAHEGVRLEVLQILKYDGKLCSPWKPPFKGKENGVNILQSIDEGPFLMGTFRETFSEGTEGLPKDIYSLINHYTGAKDIWDGVKMLLGGSKLTKEDRESKFYDDFEQFRQNKGETIHDYYVRFAKLINDMRNIKMTMSRMQLNSKFLNNMLPEWGRFLTAMKLNRGLRDSNYNQLYAYLKPHEAHANENKMMLDRFTQHTVDPLALMSNVSNQQHYPQSLTTLPSTYVQLHFADTTQLDSGLSLIDNLIENLTNTLALLTQSYKTYLPQTNNQPRTSSNPRNQATIQDGKVVVQNVQGRQNIGQRNNARGAGGQDNVVDDDVDKQPVQDLALNVDNVFQADDCDAFDSDVDEAPTAQTMFMANLSSADPVYNEVGPSYDLDILSEVHDHDHYQDAACEHHEEHEMHDDVQPTYVVDSHADYTRDSDMSPYDQFFDMHEALNAAQKRIAELESENSNLQNKIQNDDHD
nr:hypothetical protein [Tanacetum cinerariifolium]